MTDRQMPLPVPVAAPTPVPVPVVSLPEPADQSPTVKRVSAAAVPQAVKKTRAGGVAGSEPGLGPVEFDRVVPPSGNLAVLGKQFWLDPARSGQVVRFWADA